MSYILLSKMDTLEYISYHPKYKIIKIKSTRIKPNNLKLVANSTWLKIFVKTDPPPPQKQ